MVITLCGSARFESLWVEWQEKLAAMGHTVFALVVYPSQKGIREGENHEWYTEDQKMMLDLIHLSKIEESEAIVVINKDGYIGPSTKREIAWAKIRSKRVYYTEETSDLNDDIASWLLT